MIYTISLSYSVYMVSAYYFKLSPLKLLNMDTPVKHYKFINSKTDNVIYYCTLSGDLNTEQHKEKLEAIKAEVAGGNGVYLDTIYWEEIKDNKD
jgi:hypothetical protein